MTPKTRIETMLWDAFRQAVMENQQHESLEMATAAELIAAALEGIMGLPEPAQTKEASIQ